MATNRKRTPRSRRESGLTRAETDWLHSRPYPEPGQENDDKKGESGFAYFCAYFGGVMSRTGKALWDEHKEVILEEWIAEHPCTRPQRWWDFDAPAEVISNCRVFPDGVAPHRRRMGGTGTPQYEVLSVTPYFTLGIPNTWVSRFEEDYYNGRALDVDNAIIPSGYTDGDFKGQAVDVADPPRFESQAAYLQRHGLLTPDENRHLRINPHLLEDETIRLDQH